MCNGGDPGLRSDESLPISALNRHISSLLGLSPGSQIHHDHHDGDDSERRRQWDFKTLQDPGDCPSGQSEDPEARQILEMVQPQTKTA